MKADKSILGSQAGFTLVELLAVMMLMIMISVASVMSWNQIQRGLEMRTAINDVRSSMALARQYAVLKKTEIKIGFIPPGVGYCQVYYITNQAGGGLLSGGPLQLPLGVRFDPVPPDFIFKPSGSIQNGQSINLVLVEGPSAQLTNNSVLRINGLTGIITYD
jgi:prepilin-type N-terminal cleavage/methylation domain-containing protein